MMTRSYRFMRTLPLSKEEKEHARKYLRVPLNQKLAWLDRMRSFQYDIWKSNPSIYRQHEKFRRGEI